MTISPAPYTVAAHTAAGYAERIARRTALAEAGVIDADTAARGNAADARHLAVARALVADLAGSRPRRWWWPW